MKTKPTPYKTSDHLRTPAERDEYMKAWRESHPEDKGGLSRAKRDVERSKEKKYKFTEKNNYMDVRPTGFPNGVCVSCECFVDVFDDEADKFEASGMPPIEYWLTLLIRSAKMYDRRVRMANENGSNFDVFSDVSFVETLRERVDGGYVKLCKEGV